MTRGLFTLWMAGLLLVSMPASAYYYVSHWDFSLDPAGEFDFTGHNDLVNEGNVPIVDGAAVFDGTVRPFVTRHNVALLGSQPYTIECFALAEPDCDGMIMEVSPNNNSVVGGFYLYAKEGVMARTAGRNFNGEKFINGTICDGQWHHLAVILDPTTEVVTNSVQLYVDGVRQGKRSQNGGIVSLGQQHRFYIGSRGGKELPFKGQIDDVRITQGILSTNEFLKARSAGTIDVRAYWKFDSANPLADSSGNGNTLQGSQGVTFVNGCASFNGTASDVRTVNTLDLSAYKDVTVECFVRKHAGTDDVRIMLEHSLNGAGYPQGFYLSLDETGAGTIRGIFRFNTHCYGDSSTYAVNTGWHHVALIKDSSNAGDNSCISVYVDGIRVSNYHINSNASGDFLRNDYFYLGSRANQEFFLDADIDDVRVTAKVLQPGQFLRTRTGPLDDAIAYWPFDKASNMLVDASGNGNVLTGSGVTVVDGAALFDGSQSGFSTRAPLPLYAYSSLTVEWFMKSDMSGQGIVLETSANYLSRPGAFCVCANEYAGYEMLNWANVLSGWSATDGKWHHYALVYDWSKTDSDVVRVYRDGVQVTTHYASDTSAPKLRADRLFIGTRNGSGYPFVGELDDIKITGRALAPSEFMTKRSSPPGVTIIIR